MTHATVTHHTATLCAVAFAYDANAVEAVKALPGVSFDGSRWLVPVLHLPTLRPLFSTMTVAPEVVAAYHALLRRMLADLAGSTHRKGALGQRIAEVMQRHANGIAHIEKADGLLGKYLKGVMNAQKNVNRKAAIVKSKRRKKQGA